MNTGMIATLPLAIRLPQDLRSVSEGLSAVLAEVSFAAVAFVFGIMRGQYKQLHCLNAWVKWGPKTAL